MKWPMLTRRGATYYHRQVVPLALRPLLGPVQLGRGCATSVYYDHPKLRPRDVFHLAAISGGNDEGYSA